MVLHQPRDQRGIFVAQAMVAAEASCIDHTQFRVVSAASLGDIVKQPGQVEQLGAFELAHQAAAQRVLV